MIYANFQNRNRVTFQKHWNVEKIRLILGSQLRIAPHMPKKQGNRSVDEAFVWIGVHKEIETESI